MHGVRGDVMKETGQCERGIGEFENLDSDQRSRIKCETDGNWRCLGSTTSFYSQQATTWNLSNKNMRRKTHRLWNRGIDLKLVFRDPSLLFQNMQK